MAEHIPAQALAAWAPVKPAAPPAASNGPSVTNVHAAPFAFRPRGADPAATNYRPTAVNWPAASNQTVALGARQQGGSAVSVDAVAGSKAPSSARVQMLGRDVAAALGIQGVVFTVAADAAGEGPVKAKLDYSGFAEAIGGNYGSRLRLFQLPACALITPAVAACRQATPLKSVNDPASRTVSATVAVSGIQTNAAQRSASEIVLVNPAMVLSAQTDAGDGGDGAGSYAATDLNPSGTWTAGGQTGAFNYSYPIDIPASTTKVAPRMALSYDSGSIDGQTAATQAQASWAGNGWTTPRSYVEQSFVSCKDDPEGTPSPVQTSDMCYNGPILTLSLNGSSAVLVWDQAQSVWKAKDDTGEVITHVTNSGNGSGTYNTDYWTVTTRDGTVYSFGRNQIPGWSAGKATTNSVDYEPVYSSHSGDPCYQISGSGFNNSVCTMGYRWNLDYAVDLHGGAMALYYKQDFNYYGRNNGATDVTYVRDSYLDHVDYGFLDGGAFGTVPNRVNFATDVRCMTAPCTPLNDTTKANWLDLPYDLICNQGTNCLVWAPTFFSTVRLASITTQQWSTANARYEDVDSYALAHTMPATGDGTAPTLWLASITRTGKAGTGAAITLPPLQFGSVTLANRVDTVTDGLPAMQKHRIATITTESGSVMTVSYGESDPCTAPVTLDPATNTKSCYPIRWTPAGYTDAITDWFHKYAVTNVMATDPTGGSVPNTNTYAYVGGLAWHFDDNEVVKAKYRTYGQFRGYGKVQTFTGDTNNDPRTLAEKTYYRGMSKNNNTTVVNVTDSQGGVHEDLDQLAGRELESTSYVGEGGPVDHSAISHYWVSGATATRNRTGLPALIATTTGVAQTLARQAITAPGGTTWRYTQTDRSYDATISSPTFGLLLRTYMHTVPADTAYDQCSTTTYAAKNTAKNLVGLVAEKETVSVKCGGFTEGSPPSVPAGLNTLTAPTANRPSQVVSDERQFYDDQTWSTTFPQAAPVKGEVTMTRRASDYTGGAYVWQTTARSTYDGYGRQIDSYDGNDNKTTNAFTTNAVGLTTGSSNTNPLNQATSVTYDTRRGLPVTEAEANGIAVTQEYDTLGRLSSVWTHSRHAPDPANYKFSYTVANNGLSFSKTERLNESLGYQTSYVLYDALLRKRQTQDMTPQSGRVVTDTFYDSRGWTKASYNGWWDPATLPSAQLVTATNIGAQVPNQDFFTYDGLGRVVYQVKGKNGATISTTTTVYNGDRTTTLPPIGGIVTTTVTDPAGRTVELDQYTVNPTVNAPGNPFTGIFTISGGTKVPTTYGFDSHGNKSTVTDKAGTAWTSTFDLLGHVVSRADPDAGTSSNMKYDGNGNLIETTDSRGKKLSYVYDKLNRRTATYASAVNAQVPFGQAGANQLAKWVYDNSDNAVPGMTYPVGHRTSSTAYSGGAAYVKQEKGFDVFGNSAGQTVTIPSSTEGAILGSSYTITHTYSTNTGLLLQDKFPLKWGLPLETVNHGYGGVLDKPVTVGGLAGYAANTTYDSLSRVNQATIGSSPNLSYVTFTYDDHTGQLKDRLVTRAVTTPYSVDEQAYDRNLVGGIRKQVSTRLGSAATSETQCFQYDSIDRLVNAWTATDDCAVTPTSASRAMVGSNLGANSRYWTSWAIDDLGNRTQQTQWGTSTATDTATGYTYNGNGTGQPHTLTATNSTGGSPGSTTYSYDTTGNMTGRNAGQGNQVLAWDDAGRLTGITGGTAGPTSYVYDADGELLLQKEPGSTILYLPGQQITLNTSTNTTTGVRYYPLPGGETAIRTGSGTNYKFSIADPHGTSELLLDNTAQVPTWRQFTPYGAPRGAAATWPDNRGFLNKPTSAGTGLTIVGARSYDPITSRFISLDPEFQDGEPQSLNGYLYSNNNPVNYSDPSGRGWGWIAVAVIVAVVVVAVVVAIACPAVVPALIAAGSAAMEAGGAALAGGASVGAASVAAGGAAAAELAVAAAGSTAVAATVGMGGVAALGVAGLAGRTYFGGDADGPTFGGRGPTRRGPPVESTPVGVVGGKWSKGTPDDLIEPPYVPLRGTNPEPGQPTRTTDRGRWRNQTLDDSYSGAEDNPAGGKYCPTQGPNCAGTVYTSRTDEGPRDWDNSHYPSWTNRLFHPNVTRKQVLDEYNTGTFLECIPCNRGGQADDTRFHVHGGWVLQ